MKILITGGKGYLGQVFTKNFQNKYSIISLGSKELDITDEDLVLSTIKQYKPDIVIHFAAKAETKFCNEHPDQARKINVNGAVYVAKACQNIGAKLIFASTEQIFNGNREDGPYTENSIPCPNTVYGQNKWDAEQEITKILKEVWILRFTWIFGLPEFQITPSENILTSTIQKIVRNEKFTIQQNEFRGMSYIYDVIRNIEKVFNLPYGTYHFGSENDLSRDEIVKCIFENLGIQDQYESMISLIPNIYGNRRDVRLECSKISQLGIYFSPSPQAIRQCLKDFSFIKEFK